MVANLLILLGAFYFPADRLPAHPPAWANRPLRTDCRLLTNAMPATTNLANAMPATTNLTNAMPATTNLANAMPATTDLADTMGPGKGRLLYENTFRKQKALQDWVMEGPGTLQFNKGWMEMFSPGKEWDHVLWCPEDFPSSFIAEWEMQNLDTSEGLTIVFFAAKGSGGEDIFDPSLPKRDGTFKYYNKGQLNCYHISYYTNNPKNPGREKANLRKDPMFALLQQGEPGIPPASLKKHRIRLIKKDAWIRMFVDGRKVIDYCDEEGTYGPPYTGGKIGFRQMRWSHFRYRDFRVWGIKKTE